MNEGKFRRSNGEMMEIGIEMVKFYNGREKIRVQKHRILD